MILVIDTSGSELSIGLSSDDGMLLREFHAEPNSGIGERAIHDARLAMETANLVSLESIATSEITHIGIIIGPGSFTGLRIGLSFAKGLAIVTNASIVPLTLHEVLLAEARNFDGIIVTPGYRPELCYIADTSAPSSIRLATREEFLALLPRPILAHASFQIHAVAGIPGYLPESASFISPSLATMSRLTAKSTSAIASQEIDALEPLYLTEFSIKHS